jgi:phage N-6-adenine-methyltransferase
MESTFSINQSFRDRIPSLSPEERKRLEENLQCDGCREPLCVWENQEDGELYLLDGHNRFEICTRLGIEYQVIEIDDIHSEEDALDWIDRNQIGKRNLSPDDFRIISGRIYNRRKKAVGEHKGNQHTKLELPQIDAVPTSAIVASELGVSKATIERNGQRAEVYDAMKAIGDNEAAEAAKTLPQAVVSKVINEVKREEKEREEDAYKDLCEARDTMPKEEKERREAWHKEEVRDSIGKALLENQRIAIEKQNRLKVAAELKAAKAVHVSQNTGVPEWYTPLEHLIAAKEVLGTIDLDPASSEIAQRNVKAKTYYTIDDNGLSQEWFGNVWMNPPYTGGLIDQFIEKLRSHVSASEVEQAIVLVNNATETKWFQSLSSVSSAICFPAGRIRFIDPEGNLGAPLQGQAIAYIGRNSRLFCKVFSEFGLCMEVVKNG